MCIDSRKSFEIGFLSGYIKPHYGGHEEFLFTEGFDGVLCLGAFVYYKSSF